MTMPLKAFGIVSGGVVMANLYNQWNPKSYACWYLYYVSASKFQKPCYKDPWVVNKAMTKIVKEALQHDPDKEKMTLISGLQNMGKTSGVLKECHDQGRVGFFIGLGDYKGARYNEEKLDTFVVERIISNDKCMERSLLQNILYLFFPLPDSKWVWYGLCAAFKRHAKANLVLVVDETQVLANDGLQHSGIMNEFCTLSSSGSVCLVSSEYNVGQYLKMMTHVDSRTDIIFAPAATPDEMLPYVRKRCEALGEVDIKKIVESLDGSFKLLHRLEEHMEDGIDGVRAWHKEKLVNGLEVTPNGMKTEAKQASTGLAMLAAATMAFNEAPIAAFDQSILELAQVGGAKIETVRNVMRASWAAPITGDVMTELICDAAVRTIMKKKVPPDICTEFEEAIKGKCPSQPAKK